MVEISRSLTPNNFKIFSKIILNIKSTEELQILYDNLFSLHLFITTLALITPADDIY